MTKYLVTVNENRVESWSVTYLVEAESEAQARDEYQGCQVVDESYNDGYTDEEIVEVKLKGQV